MGRETIIRGVTLKYCEYNRKAYFGFPFLVFFYVRIFTLVFVGKVKIISGVMERRA